MDRVSAIYKARERGEFTIPTTIGVEKRTNPFLRCDISAELRTNVGVIDGIDSDSDAFAKVRIAKDNFRANPLDLLFLRTLQLYYSLTTKCTS